MSETPIAPEPERVPEDVEDDWMPDDYEPPDFDDPGDFPEPDHKMTEQVDDDDR